MQSLQRPVCGSRAFSGKNASPSQHSMRAPPACPCRPQRAQRTSTVTAGAGATGLSSLLDNVAAAFQPAAAPQRKANAASAPATHAAFSPPSVADSKRKFIEAYKKPVAPMYNNVIQELLVQQHFIRYNSKYSYNEIYALGVVSVFDQVLDSYDAEEKGKVFAAYLSALGEDAARFRSDAEAVEAQAREAGSPEGLVADASGNQLKQALAKVAEATAAEKFASNKFFSIGLFRLLELTGAKEPSALEKLVTSLGVRAELVNKDLMLYKGLLSKLSAAKELMKEFMERERRKQAEREAAKAAKDSADPTSAPKEEEGAAVPQQA